MSGAAGLDDWPGRHRHCHMGTGRPFETPIRRTDVVQVTNHNFVLDIRCEGCTYPPG
jgi:hypothetical protein